MFSVLIIPYCLFFLKSYVLHLTLFILPGIESHQGKLPFPGFQVEIVRAATVPKQTKDSGTQDKDDVVSDSEAEDGSSKSRRAEAASAAGERVSQTTSSSETKSKADQIASLTEATEQVSIANTGSSQARTTTEPKTNAGASVPSVEVPVSESEFKAMAADASVFSFGDDEDYESD